MPGLPLVEIVTTPPSASAARVPALCVVPSAVSARAWRERSDEELIARGREGRREALDELLRRHERRIFRVCERMAQGPDVVQDLVQETMLGIVRSITSFRGDSSFMTWVFTIARSFAHRQRRRQRAYTRTIGALTRWEESAHVDASPESALARQRLSARFETALDGLAALDREVLVARDIEGRSANEVAELTGLTVSAVKSRLHRARRQVRATLGHVAA